MINFGNVAHEWYQAQAVWTRIQWPSQYCRFCSKGIYILWIRGDLLHTSLCMTGFYLFKSRTDLNTNEWLVSHLLIYGHLYFGIYNLKFPINYLQLPHEKPLNWSDILSGGSERDPYRVSLLALGLKSCWLVMYYLHKVSRTDRIRVLVSLPVT